MDGVKSFVRTTILGGIIFLVPLVFVVVVVGKAFHILQAVAIPLSTMIPIEAVAGVAIVPILTTLIILFLSLAAGLAARSKWGQKIYEKLDTALLQLIPGYAWIKGMTGEIQDKDAEQVLTPVLVAFDDQSQLAFEVDRSDGRVAVYLPGAPDARSGAVSFVSSDRVQSIDLGIKAVNKICKNLGRNSVNQLP